MISLFFKYSFHTDSLLLKSSLYSVFSISIISFKALFFASSSLSSSKKTVSSLSLVEKNTDLFSNSSFSFALSFKLYLFARVLLPITGITAASLFSLQTASWTTLTFDCVVLDIYSIYLPSYTRLLISSKCIAPLFVTEPSIPLSIIISTSLSHNKSTFCTKRCSL